ncbi:hypothetical protein PSPO01_02703 [Paraphaeosphaeria sporulosa]
MPPAVDTINALEQGNAVERETLEKLKEGAVTLLDGLITSGVLLFKSSRSPLKRRVSIKFALESALVPVNHFALLIQMFGKLLEDCEAAGERRSQRRRKNKDDIDLNHDAGWKDVVEVWEEIKTFRSSLIDLENVGYSGRDYRFRRVMQETLDTAIPTCDRIEKKLRSMRKVCDDTKRRQNMWSTRMTTTSGTSSGNIEIISVN